MPSINALLTASLAFASIALGAPAAQDKKFTVEQVKNPKFIKNGPLALAHVYAKYGVPLPKGLEKAVKASDRNGLVWSGATRVGPLCSFSICRSSRLQDAACDLEFMATVKLFTMVVILALDIW
ncbi:Uncharacterized protein HZ326_4835 [Fusarium oxysporum f. sp. albedinis]|nr:Uncharacterized protein HZ326_4835 [Fusarium oxysporum f. sp. albedinis]